MLQKFIQELLHFGPAFQRLIIISECQFQSLLIIMLYNVCIKICNTLVGWSDMCVCRDNIDKYDTMTPTKSDRQLHCKRFPANDECLTTNKTKDEVVNKKKEDAKN